MIEEKRQMKNFKIASKLIITFGVIIIMYL